jgi:LemA protein
MSNGQIGVLVAAAILVFWMVGAYNRLVTLRSAIGSAWQQVGEVLARRGEAVALLAASLREPLAAELGALDALLSAQAQLQAAAMALGARPVAASLAAALTAAEAAWASAASRVLALLEQLPELRAEPGIGPQAAVLVECVARLAFARQLFNEAAQAYNSAARQFPTRLLTRLFGFGTAGRI